MVVAAYTDTSGIVDVRGMLALRCEVLPAKYVVALSTQALGVVLSVEMGAFCYGATRSRFAFVSLTNLYGFGGVSFRRSPGLLHVLLALLIAGGVLLGSYFDLIYLTLNEWDAVSFPNFLCVNAKIKLNHVLFFLFLLFVIFLKEFAYK